MPVNQDKHVLAGAGMVVADRDPLIEAAPIILALGSNEMTNNR